MSTFPETVSIRTGARLHFGPLSYRPETGRSFGGIGLMVERPGVELTATSRTGRRPSGIDSPRTQQLLTSFKDRLPVLQFAFQVDLAEEIPAHQGLGSGTQLSLALMEALLALRGEQASITRLAELAARGDRSAVGLYGYEQGGFLFDAGHAPGESIGQLACRVDFPEEWPVLLLHPQDARGLSGAVELKAFEQLGAMPELTCGRLCRLALTELLPAIQSRNFHDFTVALFEYGQLVGDFFRQTQGGVFASPAMRQLLQQFPHVAHTGMAQSSWGPTIAMFAENESHASELRRQLRELIPDQTCRIEITRARNRGREIRIG